jgi:hypothetical protein
MNPSSILYTGPMKPTTSGNEEATTPVSRRRDLRRHHPALEQTTTTAGDKGRPEGRGARSLDGHPTNSGAPATRYGPARSSHRMDQHHRAPLREIAWHYRPPPPASTTTPPLPAPARSHTQRSRPALSTPRQGERGLPPTTSIGLRPSARPGDFGFATASSSLPF